jgi:hypothetical protein
MTTNEYFTPGTNPDLSQVDQTSIGVDTTITPEIIKAKSQPFSTDETGGIIIPANVTFGDSTLITPLPNPNLNNQLVLSQIQVGGTVLANDIILGVMDLQR